MTFPLALAQIGTHVTAAGAALTNPISDVAQAHPVPRGQRCIRYWYDGEGPAQRMGGQETLGSQMVGLRVMIVAYWQMSSTGEVLAAAIDNEAFELTSQLNTRLIGDKQLGGQCTDMTVGDALVAFVPILGANYRTLEMELVLEFPELWSIAP